MKFLALLVLASAALAAPLPPAGPAYASPSNNYPTFAVRHVQPTPECDNATTVSAESLFGSLTGIPILGSILGPLAPLLAPLKDIVGGATKGLPILDDLLNALLDGGAKGASVESLDDDGKAKNGTEPTPDWSQLEDALDADEDLADAVKDLSSVIRSMAVAMAETSSAEQSTTPMMDAPTPTAGAAGVDETTTESTTWTESPPAEQTNVELNFKEHIGEEKKERRL
ncbi:hypothetical protein AURDEDRAFT_174827 [Auricularia subglabra TFB-10046 SS5]|nr:hypothetical protein AURDEDRAFT_174827 [Auricularia subglabra TFB-10046 SS5]